MKAMKLRTVTSDGTPCPGEPFPYYPIDPDTGRPYAGDDGTAGVVIWIQPLTRTLESDLRKRFTKVEHVKGVGAHETVDAEALYAALVDAVIVRWDGVLAADGRPVPCVDEAKRALDADIRAEILFRARRPATVDVEA